MWRFEWAGTHSILSKCAFQVGLAPLVFAKCGVSSGLLPTRFLQNVNFRWVLPHSILLNVAFRVGLYPLVLRIKVLSSGTRIVDRRWKRSTYLYYLILYGILRREYTHSFRVEFSVRVGPYPLIFNKSLISSGLLPTRFCQNMHFRWAAT